MKYPPPFSRSSVLVALALAGCGTAGTAAEHVPSNDESPNTGSPEAAPSATPEGGAPAAANPRNPIFRTGNACPAVGSAGDPLVIATDRGAVRGLNDGDTRVFRGIPFAAPPIGSLRFARPQDIGCWSGVRDAQAFGSECTQRLSSTSLPEGSEDCLFLNVWTPSTEPSKKRPVLFFVHGGAEVAGASNQTLGTINAYDGRSFASREDVVVVTVNYRLGPLGFLSLAGLDAPNGGAISGNWALMDIIAALEWVGANIERFGGDPSRVMLFGESAGALNTCALVASPLTQGLFASALMESGACSAAPVAYRRQQAAALANAQGCAGSDAAVVDCLRQKAATTLVPAASDDVSFLKKDADPKASWYLGWGPVIDGFVLPEAPLEAIAQSKHQQVPFAIGTNANETELFIPAVINTCLDYTVDVQSRFGALATQVLDRYPCLAYPTARQAEVDWTTDAQFTCEARRAARAVATHQAAPVYRYLYTHAASGSFVGMRAYHASELPFVFGTYRLAPGALPTPGEEKLSASLQGYWSRFAAAGDPNGSSALDWPLYATSTERVLVLDESVSTTDKLRNEKCDFWDSLL